MIRVGLNLLPLIDQALDWVIIVSNHVLIKRL